MGDGGFGMQSLGVKAKGKGLGDEGQCIRDEEWGDWGGRIVQVIVIRARVHGLRFTAYDLGSEAAENGTPWSLCSPSF